MPFPFAIIMAMLGILAIMAVGHEQTIGLACAFIILCRLAFIAGQAAGVTAIVATLVVFAFYGYRSYTKVEQPSENVQYSEYMKELRKNNYRTAEAFAPEAPGQAKIFRGVMVAIQKHAKALGQSVDQAVLGEDGNIGFSVPVESTELYKLAVQVKKNSEDYRKILRQAEIPVPGSGSANTQPVDLTVNLKNSDGDKVIVQPGEKVELSVKQAKYSIVPIIIDNPSMILDNFVDADGMVIDDPDDRFIASRLPRYGTMYRKGDGPWIHLGMGTTAVVKNKSGEPMEITISVNDIKSTFNNSRTFDNNKGTLVISIDRSDIDEGYASIN